MSKPTQVIELFDWIVSSKNVRGSFNNDNGNWQNASAKPVAFDPKTRIVTLEDGKNFLLQIKNICSALKINKISEKCLLGLPLTYNGPIVPFYSSDVFINVKDDDNLLEKGCIKN